MPVKYRYSALSVEWIWPGLLSPVIRGRVMYTVGIKKIADFLWCCLLLHKGFLYLSIDIFFMVWLSAGCVHSAARHSPRSDSPLPTSFLIDFQFQLKKIRDQCLKCLNQTLIVNCKILHSSLVTLQWTD